MNWLNPLTITLGLTGIIFWGLSVYVKTYPPQHINHLYGYRTKASMRSQERWDYAQQYSSKILIRTGKILVVVAVVSMFLPGIPDIFGVILSVFVVIAACIHLMVETEKELKAKFG